MAAVPISSPSDKPARGVDRLVAEDLTLSPIELDRPACIPVSGRGRAALLRHIATWLQPEHAAIGRQYLEALAESYGGRGPKGDRVQRALEHFDSEVAKGRPVDIGL